MTDQPAPPRSTASGQQYPEDFQIHVFKALTAHAHTSTKIKMPRQSAPLSQLEELLLHFQPFSDTLFRQILPSDALIALSQCSTTLNTLILKHRLLLRSEVDLRCQQLLELRPGPADGTSWQDVWRAFPRSPPYTIPEATFMPLFRCERYYSRTHDATVMRRAHGYWASKGWTPSIMISFICHTAKYNRSSLKTIHLNHHPTVTDSSLHFLLFGPKLVDHEMKLVSPPDSGICRGVYT